ncbi:LysR family transcriptional regulator [Streptomyces hesseae]|uniref:LysR family transcriptional regulator n=1 Tax=Streptomyces hesseae TaxID=3075519 RepID=A0ABU2SF68_9ACTN|nr:LysR family transcriptional regulator [Streptomyces sp. DSM 40473]MDT0447623.1 LysR family transcriptional regulator [Streptomyces sp. DSM 40473]
MDSRYLRAFVTVVDTGGISAAAAALGYAQSTLSVQLRRLEKELDAEVLRRSPTGTTLTEAGRLLLPYARESLELEERMRRAVGDRAPRLRLGALESLAVEWLPDILAAFGRGAAGPGTGAAEVRLKVAGRAVLQEELAAGRLDLVFLFDNGAPGGGPSLVVGHDRTVAVTGPGHRLARARGLAPEELLEEEFLVAEAGCTSQMLVDRFGRDLSPRARLGMVTGSLAALRRLAAHGRGIALLPHLAARQDLDTGELVELDVRQGLEPVSIEARWRTGLGPAERPLQALISLARRNAPWAAESSLTGVARSA